MYALCNGQSCNDWSLQDRGCLNTNTNYNCYKFFMRKNAPRKAIVASKATLPYYSYHALKDRDTTWTGKDFWQIVILRD